MRMVYVVVAAIFSAIGFVCTQTAWEYQYIIEYIAVFFASWFVALIFIHQDETDRSKGYKFFSLVNIIYIIVLALVILVGFRNYSLSDWRTLTPSFWKAVFCLNGIQTLLTMCFYKIRDWFVHM